MNEAPPGSPSDRPAIRVFISSTFRDMHAERDVLNRQVFPELRRRCQARGAEFVGLDLRWGVTEDEIQREGTLAICLQEVEQCRPFFVCLLGERFGSVYPPDEVPERFWDAVPREPALRPLVEQWYRRDDTVTSSVYRLRREPGLPLQDDDATALVRYWEAQALPGAGDSLTAHEIFRGVLEAAEPPAHALSYVRAPGLTAHWAFPPALVPVFVETDPARQQKLHALKARIRGATDRLTVRDYPAHYAGLTIDPAFVPSDLSAIDRAALASGVVTPEDWPTVSPALRAALEQHGTVAFTREDRDALAAQVIADLWRGIEPGLARPVTRDAHQRDRAYHERFVTHHTALFQGRHQELNRIRYYVAKNDDREILVVTGEPGAGKSAFLAACVQDARTLHPDALVIPHFIGAAPESASLSATLRSLCETLRREVLLEDAVAEDPDKLRVQLRAFLEQAGARRPVILFVDALNQLDPAGRSHDLDWLPLSALPGTRIIVSTLAGDCLVQVTRRVPADHVLTLPSLPADDRRALITAVLTQRRKRLTDAQLTTLLDTRTRPDAALPLYTLVALEELCLFGEYGALDERLAKLPPTLPKLFEGVLARLEQDHTRPTVEALCTWLAVARAGLLESEVLDLLSTDKPFPPIRWTRLYRALESHLKPIEEEAATDGATGRLDFHHDQLRLAILRRYLQMTADKPNPTDAFRAAHRQLAKYFRSVVYDETLPTKWRFDCVRGLSELPFHQTHANLWDDVNTTLTDLGFLAAKCTAQLVFELQDDYRSALAALQAGPGLTDRLPSVQHAHNGDETLHDFLSFIKGNAHILRDFPHLIWQQALNLPDTSTVRRRATSSIARGAPSRWSRLAAATSQSDPTAKGHAQPSAVLRHGAPVQRCFVAADGSRILSLGFESASLWNPVTGELIRSVTVPDLETSTADSNADVDQLLGCAKSVDKGVDKISRWTLDSGTPRRLWKYPSHGQYFMTIMNGWILISFSALVLLYEYGPHPAAPPAAALLPSVYRYPAQAAVVALVLTLVFGPTWLWWYITKHWVFHQLALRADGGRFATLRRDGRLDLRTADGGAVWRTNVGVVTEQTIMTFLPSDQNLLIATPDSTAGTVTLSWIQAQDGQVRNTVALRHSVRKLTVSTNKRLLCASCIDGTLLLFSASDGAVVRRCRSPMARPNVFGIADDASVIACADRESLLIANLETSKELRVDVRAHDITAMCFTPSGDALVTGGGDGRVRLWEVSSLLDKAAIVSDDVPGATTRVAAFMDDGSHVLAGNEDGTLMVRDARTLSAGTSYKLHDDAVLFVAAARTRDVAVSASTSTTTVWHLSTGSPVVTLGVPRFSVALWMRRCAVKWLASWPITVAGVLCAGLAMALGWTWLLSLTVPVFIWPCGWTLTAGLDSWRDRNRRFIVSCATSVDCSRFFVAYGSIGSALHQMVLTTPFETIHGFAKASGPLANVSLEGYRIDESKEHLSVPVEFRASPHMSWPVICSASRPFGDEVLTVSNGGSVVVTRGNDGRRLRWKGLRDASIVAADWSASGELALLTRHGVLGVISASDFSLTRAPRVAHPVQAIKLGRGDRLRTHLSEESSGGRCCAFSPDGAFLCTGGADGYLKVWALVENVPGWIFHAGAAIRCVSWAPDGRRVLGVTDEGKLFVIELMGT